MPIGWVGIGLGPGLIIGCCIGRQHELKRVARRKIDQRKADDADAKRGGNGEQDAPSDVT